MGNSRSAGWIAGTVVVIIAIFIATWFFFAKPRFESADATLAEAADIESNNADLQVEVDQLRIEATKLEDYREELAQIAVQIPPEARLADFTHTVAEYAEDADVTVVELSPGVATDVTLATPTPVSTPTPEPTTEPTEGDETAEGDDAAEPGTEDGATAEPAPTTPETVEQIEGFIAVPITMVVAGEYANVLDYVQMMQVEPARLFLVTDIEATRLTEAEASRGRPEQEDGDLEMRIMGFLYVLQDESAAQPEPTEGEEGDEPAEATLPKSNRNPFVPLVPSGAE